MLAFPAAVCTDDASAAAAPRPAEDDSWTLKTTKEVPLEETCSRAPFVPRYRVIPALLKREGRDGENTPPKEGRVLG